MVVSKENNQDNIERGSGSYCDRLAGLHVIGCFTSYSRSWSGPASSSYFTKLPGQPVLHEWANVTMAQSPLKSEIFDQIYLADKIATSVFWKLIGKDCCYGLPQGETVAAGFVSFTVPNSSKFVSRLPVLALHLTVLLHLGTLQFFFLDFKDVLHAVEVIILSVRWPDLVLMWFGN